MQAAAVLIFFKLLDIQHKQGHAAALHRQGRRGSQRLYCAAQDERLVLHDRAFPIALQQRQRLRQIRMMYTHQDRGAPAMQKAASGLQDGGIEAVLIQLCNGILVFFALQYSQDQLFMVFPPYFPPSAA